MIGTTLSHYSILSKLGEGGMGEVYRARDTVLERDVALKILPDEIADDAERCRRFEHEAKAVAALSHPNIVAIYELGQDRGRSFAAMELLEGESLRERLAKGALSPRKAVELAAQVAAGLAAAHERGVVHRDLKPENLFITTKGRAKILDFGLARAELEGTGLDPTAITRSLTAPGTVMGTVGYMSPEQVRGESVDARSDIFSLGVVLYEMLTGAQAFAGGSAGEVMGAILRDEPPPLRACDDCLPESLERIVQHCLEKRSEERFQSASDLGFALTIALTPSGSAAEPSSVRGAARMAPWSGLLLAGGIGAAVTLGVAVLVHERSPGGLAPVRLSTLTYSGRDWAPTASPDGEMIAFTSDRSGISCIWLKQVVGGGEAPLTEGPDDLARFSPDGSQLLFVRDRDGIRDLYRTAVVGGQQRKVLSDVLEADWSPDGSQVVFLRMARVSDSNMLTVGVAGVQGGEQRVLAEIENRLCYGVRWSPSGRQVALCETGLHGMLAGDSHLVVIDVATGAMERVALTNWPGPYTAIQWAPNGHSLVAGQAAHVLARVSDLPSQVMAYDLETRSSQALFWVPLRMPYTGWTFSTIAVLDARRVVTDEQVVQARLLEIPWPGAEGAEPVHSLTRGQGRDRQPAYSPDGSRVVFSSSRSGNIDLWIVDRETGTLHQLTDDPADDWDPAFTPDGGHVLWSSNRGGNMEVWMAAADGSRARQVTHDGVDAENPTMTADGRWIVYASASDAKLGVWRIHPDGSEATRVVASSVVIPEVSPDGRFALFLLLRGAEYVIRVVEVESGELVPFEIELSTVERGVNTQVGRARWTPDSRAIVFVSKNDQGRYGLFMQDFVPGVDTSQSRTAVAGFSVDYFTESFGISPDGTSLVISAMVERRSLKLAEGVPLTAW